MRFLPPQMSFPSLLIISYFFGLGRAIDCGGNQLANIIVVDQQGRGAFTTLQAAIDSIPINNGQWIKIQLTPGTYTEKVEIPRNKPCIFLKGTGPNSTLVTYSDDNRTTTFTSSPDNVILSGITFQNTYGIDAPATAAAIYGEKVAIFNCGFLGYQDTLFDAAGRHYYKNSYIQGEVDFIFGGGQSYFEDCVINATQNVNKPSGFVTAQSRKTLDEPSGYVFRRGQVVGIGKVDLGRAWGPFSRVIFWETSLSAVVNPEGWNAWDFKGHENNFTYAEINCTGLGSNTDSRVPWEKKPEEINLTEFSLSSFVNREDWLSKIPSI